ncbi:MAG: metallophosphoesterase [Alphaproteobacteria bacterium]
MAGGVIGKAISTIRRKPGPKGKTVPPFHRVYAIGDIHGRLDLLDDLLQQIVADREAAKPARAVLIYLGDYVDRGPDSRGVIDRLLAPPPDGFDVVHLLGNHEALMLHFLADDRAGFGWLSNGGVATLASYGIEVAGEVYRREDLTALRVELRERLPDAHRQFLQGLGLHHREGDYLFVHAGIRPGVPLDDQTADDLIWIREAFLDSKADHGFVVVHGHSIRQEVVLRANRIGIDTGAFASGTLTCLVLQDDRYELLQTGQS